jgi:hypothetical protein
MRERDPMKYLGEFAILPRPEKKMPMIAKNKRGRESFLTIR